MGFKQRERKRKRKAAMNTAQAKARASGSSSGRWWLTLATKTTCCANPDCALILREGRELVYRATPRTALCLPCADRSHTKYRCSTRWQAEHDRKRARKVGRS